MNASALDIQIKPMPAHHVACVRHVGPYERIGDAFSRLFAWAGSRGMLGSDTLTLGIYWDDPAATPAEALRSDAAITVPNTVELAGEIVTQTLPAGDYAVFRTAVFNNDFKAEWDKLTAWLSSSGYRSVDGPCFEIYHNNAMTDPDRKWIIDICIPVRKA